jgi:predicted transcriptional regulator
MKYDVIAIFVAIVCLSGLSIAEQNEAGNLSTVGTADNLSAAVTFDNGVDGRNITAMMLREKELRDQYSWADPIIDDIAMGKIDRFPGTKDYVPLDEPMPRPTPLLMAPPPSIPVTELDPVVQVGILSAIFILLKSLPLVVSRIENVLLNKTRSGIFSGIRESPGLTVSQLSRKLSINRGTLLYHLNVLKSDGKIAMKRNGKSVEVFDRMNRFTDEERTVMGCVGDGMSKSIVKAIVENPGITNTQIAYKVHIKKSSVYWHLQRLLSKNIVFYESEGKLKRYHITKKYDEIVQKFL